MSGKFKARGNVFRFRFTQLTEFTSNNEVDSKRIVRPKLDPQERRLSYFDICCPRCGACGEDWIIRRGLRLNKRKGPVQRYGCKRCGRRFSLESWGHFPLWVVEAVLSLAVKGLGFNEIVDELKKEALRHNLTIKISRQSVFNIIKRSVEAFLRFEQDARPENTSLEWQIDDTPQRSAKGYQESFEQPKSDDRKRKFWITNVLEVDSRYWLVAHVSFLERDKRARDAEVSEKAVRMALKRARDAPQCFRCDGLRAHIKGIRNCLPLVAINSKKKSEVFSHINLIESLHSSMRRKAVKKRKKFRCLATLQLVVDLVRVYHNFLHRLDALGGITPAAKVGIAPLFRSWGEFIRYVYRHSK